MIFGRFQEFMDQLTSKHDVLGPQNEVLKHRISDCSVCPTLYDHNLFNISPN